MRRSVLVEVCKIITGDHKLPEDLFASIFETTKDLPTTDRKACITAASLAGIIFSQELYAIPKYC